MADRKAQNLFIFILLFYFILQNCLIIYAETTSNDFYCVIPEKEVKYRQNKLDFTEHNTNFIKELEILSGNIKEDKKIKTVDIDIIIPSELLNKTIYFKDNGVDARACFTTNLYEKLKGTELESILNAKNNKGVLDYIFSQESGYITKNKIFYKLSINKAGDLEVCVSRPLSRIEEEDLILKKEVIKKKYNSDSEKKTYIIDDADNFLEGVLYFFKLKNKKQIEISFNISAELAPLECKWREEDNKRGLLNYLKTIDASATETGNGCRVKIELDTAFLSSENIEKLVSEEFYPHILITKNSNLENHSQNIKALDELVSGYRNNAKNIFRISDKIQDTVFIYKANSFNSEYQFTIPDSVCNNETEDLGVLLFFPLKSNAFLKFLGDAINWILYIGSFTIYDGRNKNLFDNKYNNVYNSFGAYDLSKNSLEISKPNILHYNLDYIYNIPVTKTTKETINSRLPKVGTNLSDKKFLCPEKTPPDLTKKLSSIKFTEENTKFVYETDSINLISDNDQINIHINSNYLSNVENFKENDTDARVCFSTTIPENILYILNTTNNLENKSSAVVNGSLISIVYTTNSKLYVCFVRPLTELKDPITNLPSEIIINDQKYKNYKKSIEEVYDKENKNQKNGSTIFSLTTALQPLSCIPRSSLSYVDFDKSQTTIKTTDTGKGCEVNVNLKDNFWTPDRISKLSNENFYPHILITKTIDSKETNYKNLNSFINLRKRNAFNVFQLFSYNIKPETNFIYKAEEFKTNYKFIVPDTVCDNTTNSVDMIIYTPIKSNKFFEIVEKGVGWIIYIFTFTLVDIRDRSLLDYQYDNVYSSTEKLDIGRDASKIIEKLNEGHTFYNLGIINNLDLKKDSSTISGTLPLESNLKEDQKFNCLKEEKTIEERLKIPFDLKNSNFILSEDALKITIKDTMIYIETNNDYLSQIHNFKENGIDSRVCFITNLYIQNYEFKNKETATLVNGRVFSEIKILKDKDKTNIRICISRPVDILTDEERTLHDLKYKENIKFSANQLILKNNLNIEKVSDLEKNKIDSKSFIFSLNAKLATLGCSSEEDNISLKEAFDCVIPEITLESRLKLKFNEKTSNYFYQRGNKAILLSEDIIALENTILVYDINIDSEYINKAGHYKENGMDARVCFVKTLDGEVIDNLNIKDTYIATAESTIDNGIIIVNVKTIREKTNKLEICISRPTRKLLDEESKIRNLYVPKEYNLNAVKKFLGIDWLRKDEKINKVIFRINIDLPKIHCITGSITPEIETKEAFDCLLTIPEIKQRQEMDYTTENTKYYYATGALSFKQTSNSKEMNVQLNIDSDYLKNVYNFKENGVDARVCFVENIANISTNHFVSSLYYIKKHKKDIVNGDVLLRLETSEKDREIKFCISRPVRELTDAESEIKNLTFDSSFDYMLKREFLGIDFFIKDKILKTMTFSIADFTMEKLFCIGNEINTDVPINIKYISEPSLENRCYDPFGFIMNEGYTGEKIYYEYGFNRLLFNWDKDDIEHNNCDYGYYCDQDQLKLSILKKIELLNTENKTTLEDVVFRTEKKNIEKNNLLEADTIFKDEVINSLKLTNIKDLSVKEYLVALDAIIQTIPTDLREIIILKTVIVPTTNINREDISKFILEFTDNNYSNIDSNYYFTVKSYMNAKSKFTEYYNALDSLQKDQALDIYFELLRNIDIYFGDAITPTVVNTKTFGLLDSGLTKNILEEDAFLKTDKKIIIDSNSEIKKIDTPNSVKIKITNTQEPTIKIEETNISNILNYYKKPSYNLFKQNILFTNPINAYYYNYSGKIFKEQEIGKLKDTEIINNFDIWSKTQDGYILNILTNNNSVKNVNYKNIRPIQFISMLNNTYLIEYNNAGGISNLVNTPMYWYDNINSKQIEAKPNNRNIYSLTGAKSYKSTIFAFVNSPSQKIRIYSKNPFITNYKFKLGLPSSIINNIEEKEYFEIPSDIINEKFKTDEKYNIKSIISNIPTENICFNFYNGESIKFWYNPEKVSGEE